MLDAAVLSAPPRLKIYSSLLRDADASRPQPNFGGVPYALMDYLVTTSLILVTDIEEWMHRPVEDVDAARSAMDAFLPESMRNWRKSRASYVPSSHSHSPSDPVTPGGNSLWGDDARSFISESAATPSSTTSHPYSAFWHNPEPVPPVPQVPPELQSSTPPLSRSTTLGRRRLPLPPGQLTPSPQARPDQPWLNNRPQSSSEPSTSGSSEMGSATFQLQLVSPASTTPPLHEFSRSSGSINRRQLPQQRPAPQHSVPLPPKLRDEYRGEYPPQPLNSIPSQDEAEPGSSGRHDADGDDHVQEQERALDPENRQGERDTLYELPPPAYDAIDFSMPRPPLPGLPPNFQSFSIPAQPTESS